MEITLSSDNIKELVVKHIKSLNIGSIENIKFINRRSNKIEAVVSIITKEEDSSK